MAKPRTPNQKKRYAALNKRLGKYVSLVQDIFDSLGLEAASIVTNSTNYDGTKPFRFSDYPQTKARVNDLMRYFSHDIQALIYSGTTEEWKQSNLVQDLLANDVLKTYGMRRNGERVKQYYLSNNDALKAFQKRKDKGMTVSQKIWNQSFNFKRELEYAISSAIEKGQSAVSLSKRISKYLHDFPSLQSDYKKRFGTATDCKDCEYRSIRLARSEINMAYREAEQTRWRQMDFIKGYEIKLSHSHPKHDICDELAGIYPKWFKWPGWHPNDLCYAIPIVMTDDEWYSGKGRVIDELPKNFTQWAYDNYERIKAAESRDTLPYFLKDNFSQVDSNKETYTYKSLTSFLEHKPTKHGESFAPIPMKAAELDDARMIENRNNIARLIGFSDEEISKMKPMGFSDANSGNVNALTGKDINTRENCQLCCPVFEMRCRGINVTAKGYVKEGYIEELSNDQTLAYLTKEGKKPALTANFSTRKELETFLSGSEIAKNGRYQLGINRWLNNRDGHIVCLIRAKGKTYLYDGQRKMRYDINDIIENIDFSKEVQLLRTDKLLLDPRVIQICERL